MRKLVTLFKEFINAPIQIFSGATFKKGLYDLLDVYDNTTSGDLVIVKGNHDIGDNSIHLKDGVNWLFMGNPTISSDSSNGTIKDGGVDIDTHFQGKLTIQNSVSPAYRISLSNASSSLKGFAFIYDAILFCESGECSITKTFINDFVDVPVLTFDSMEDHAFLTFAHDLVPSSNTNVNIYSQIHTRLEDEMLIISSIGGFGNSVLNFRATTFSGLISQNFKIKMKFEISYE
jgi:hypothetical protein